jgi:hypothetical protein
MPRNLKATEDDEIRRPEQEDDTEGHSLLVDPASARQLSRARDQDVERQARDRQRQREARGR